MRSAEVCDFCRGGPVTWAYPCRDFTHHVKVPRGSLTFNSSGGWAACEVCHGLIERSDRDRLCSRSAVTHPKAKTVPMRDLRRMVRGLHDDFWANREGPAVPDPGDGRDPTRQPTP